MPKTSGKEAFPGMSILHWVPKSKTSPPKSPHPCGRKYLIRRGEGGEERLGGPLWSPIRTNLSMVEFDFIKRKQLPRPLRSVRLEENRLLTVASLHGSLLQKDAPWSICRSVSVLTGAPGPCQGVWLTASPFPQRCCLAQIRRGVLAGCSLLP